MPASPDQQWRQLTSHYAQMWDDELLNLASGYNDLTDMAKQVLRDEMRKRNLGDPSAPVPKRAAVQADHAEPTPPQPAFTPAARQPVHPTMGPNEMRELQRCREHYTLLADEDLEDLVAGYGDLTPMAQQALRDEMLQRGFGDLEDQAEAHGDELDDDGHDPENPLLASAELHAQNTDTNEWWVRVVETDDSELAKQYAIMLSSARILYRWRTAPSGGQFIEAAADQAEEALRVLAQPIPQSVIAESKEDVSEFEMPHCPRCRNQEPTLIGAEPSNQWLCESCGHQWNEPVAEPKQI
jgi:hypothetical protein